MKTWPQPHLPLLPGAGLSVTLKNSQNLQSWTVPQDSQITLYVCGITPYDATHIGHASTYITFDVLNRVLRDSGARVTYISNVTDVDDPLLERANLTGVNWQDLAIEQINLYAEDMTALGVIPPDYYRGVVEIIPDLVESITRLVAENKAYQVPNEVGTYDIYADLSTDADFARSLNLSKDELEERFTEFGGKLDLAGKRNRLDPLLWFAQRPGEPSWPANDVLGAGRPGWHIECAQISLAASEPGLIDIQGGGADLCFPHHEMSNSHLRQLSGNSNYRPKLSLYSGLVAYEGAKMSKSRGNLVFVSALRRSGINPMVIRLAILANHYWENWTWDDALLQAANSRFELWSKAFSSNGAKPETELIYQIRKALANNLDTVTALRLVDNWAQETLLASANNETEDFSMGAPGVVSRTVDALLGIRF